MRYSVLFISSCVLALQHVGYAFGQHMVTRNSSPWNAPVLLDPEVEGLISLVKTTTYSCATSYYEIDSWLLSYIY